MFGAKHDMLELPAIPKDRQKLQVLINDARRERKRKRLIYALALVCFVAGLIILALWYSGHTGAPAATATHVLYLPISIR